MSTVKRGRLLSVALTEPQVLAGIKTETRRLGWWTDKNGRRLVKPGDPLQLVRKAMGRKPDEPLVVLARVEVVEVRREPLHTITPVEVTAEGFPGWGPNEFVEFFAREMGCHQNAEVTVIRWPADYEVRCPNDCTRFGGRVPGWTVGSNWEFVPCQTCGGSGFVPVNASVAS